MGAAASAALPDGVSLGSPLQVGDLSRVSMPVSTIFRPTLLNMDQHQDSLQHAVMGLSV